MAAAPDLNALQIFTLQLAVMLNAGVSLSRGLEVLSQMPGPMAQVAHSLLYGVESGKRLSAAMEEQRDVFPLTYRRVIRVGESTGHMLAVLPALAASLAGQMELQRRLRASLTYPAFVLSVSGAMVSFLMFYQLPRLLSAFGSGPQLPLLTRVVMMSLKPLGSLLVLGVLGALALAVALSRSETFRAWFLQKLARVPVIGPLLHEYFLIQVCGDLALMLSQGVDLSRSLRTVVTGGSGWPPLDEALGKTLDEVLHGEDLSDALSRADFPRLLTILVRSSEELGRLEGAFKNYFEMGQCRIHYASEAFLQMLEPCLHLFMGLVVGTLVLACFLPIYQTLQTI